MEGRALKPLQLTGNLGENWRQWKQNFEIYSTATELDVKSEKIQCAQLLFQMGEKAVDIFNTFTFLNDEKNKIAKLIQKFDDYFLPKNNITYERHKFFTARQNNRTIEEFVLALKDQAQECNFPDDAFKSELIKSMLIVGIKDEKVREHLLHQEYTLQNAIEVCNLASTQLLENNLNPTINLNSSDDDDDNNMQKTEGKQLNKKLNITKFDGSNIELQNGVEKQLKVQGNQNINTELELLEKNRSNATFRFNVPILKISNLKNENCIYSSTCYVRNLPWKIGIKKIKNFLGIYLFCAGKMETESSWSCSAVAELRLLPIRLNAKIISDTFSQLEFEFKGQGYGFHNFIELKEVLDAEKGYIENDSITFEAFFHTDVPKELPKERI